MDLTGRQVGEPEGSSDKRFDSGEWNEQRATMKLMGLLKWKEHGTV